MRRELPYDPSDTHAWRNLHEATLPTAIEALMSGHEGPTVEQYEPLRERLLDAIDSLSERDRIIFDGCFIERLTIRECGERLCIPKSTVWNRRNSITKHLRNLLQDDPLVKEYLAR